jgi:hypothetical protein
MKMSEQQLSLDAQNRLHGWALARCPALLQDPEVFQELLAIVQREAEEQIKAKCWKTARKLKPCRE